MRQWPTPFLGCFLPRSPSARKARSARSRVYSASIPLAAWRLRPVVLKPRSGRGLAPTTRRIITSSPRSKLAPGGSQLNRTEKWRWNTT